LRPEVGKTKEIGINVKKNDLFFAGDSFRGKFNLFRNDVEDYIDAVAFSTPAAPPYLGRFMPFYQYQNIAAARIQGFEAETMYDAGLWFAGVSATIQEGKNVRRHALQHPAAEDHHHGGIRFAERKAVLRRPDIGEGNSDIPPNICRDLV